MTTNATPRRYASCASAFPTALPRPSAHGVQHLAAAAGAPLLDNDQLRVVSDDALHLTAICVFLQDALQQDARKQLQSLRHVSDTHTSVLLLAAVAGDGSDIVACARARRSVRPLAAAARERVVPRA